MSRKDVWAAALVLALALFNCFAGLGSARLDNMDEARYGVSAYEMAHGGSLLVTTYAGQREYWNLKPPLGYWILAAAFSLLGPSFFSLRLTSALCGVGVVGLTLLIGRRWFSPRVGWIAGFIVATAYGFFCHHGARSGDLDALLSLLLVLSMLQVEKLGRSRWSLVALAGLLALGFLLKSFAIGPIGLVALVEAVWSGAWRRQSWAVVLLAAAVFILPVGGWAIARTQADGSTYFVERMFREDLCSRSLQQIDQGSYSPWNYVGSLHDRLAPWPFFVWAAALLGARRRRWRWTALAERLSAPQLRLVLLWAVLPLALFSLARTQHHWYLDPVYPAWALLAALAIERLLSHASAGRRSAALAAILVLSLAFCEARVVSRVLLRDRLPESQRFLLSLAARRQVLGPSLRTGRLMHAERFILEALDGYQVKEPRRAKRPALVPTPTIGAAPPNPAAPTEPDLTPQPGDRLLLESPDYSLYRGAVRVGSGEAETLLVRRAWPVRRRGHHRRS